MDSLELEEVRRKAREVWSRRDDRPTSYQGYFTEKLRDSHTAPSFHRPSEQRRNRPHPSLIFMSCHLQNVPGYFDSDAVGRQSVYKVDALVPPTARKERDALRSKYVARLSSEAMRQYRGNEFQRYDYIVDPYERNEKIAWDKINDRNRYLYSAPDDWKDNTYCPDNMKDDEIISLRSYIKRAANGESRSPVQHSTFNSRPPSVTLGQLKMQDISRMGSVRPRPVVSSKGDFAIHPEWPSTLRHHRLNGLQSPWPT